ncbi:hypothetical protein SprV_0200808700 [Sparganum proliferum]
MSTACLCHHPKHGEAAAYVFPWGSVPKIVVRCHQVQYQCATLLGFRRIRALRRHFPSLAGPPSFIS